MKKIMNSKKRYNILALIFGTVVINYLDRTNISVAAAAISESLELSTVQMGLIFSVFGIAYAALQIPGGIIVDKVRLRFLYAFMLLLWSIATLFQGFISSFKVLLGLRASIGVFEAPSYPANNAIVTKWFPEHERASAIAIYTSGQFIGLAFLFPVLTLIQDKVGWRGLLIVSGIIGIVWAFIWYAFYRDPDQHKTVSEQELKLIQEGGGLVNVSSKSKEKEKFNWDDFFEAFKHKKLWGIYIGQFCMGSMSIFFLTWFPTYLVEYRGLDFIKSGFLASIPFLAAFCGVLLAGFSSDYLVKKGRSPEFARKLPVLVGLALSSTIIGANFTDSTFLIIMFLTIAFFGNGLASITWVFVSLIAPKRIIGLVGGVFNLIGGLSAVIVPSVIGFLVQDGDFSPALFFIGGLTVVGFLSFLLVVGKVKRIELKE
ncbi:ACS family D-galactonate transporter-like MFS transporter [Maribacter vaceletii]|uniref:ACS family D-galactonate transporter-like MFS transporter n=1 Tax=Maribacter vaceletii TaxID=1206816 RepID=A0A495E6L2_9FLAO|nr:MFS transporter [Maribacter vaceletii]RKR12199.1 ACS family D-galactonate transporter-like MFS transporter [Maribacter vaceletii]